MAQLGGTRSSAVAQITADTTLPNNTAITRTGELITIDEGTVSQNGKNLFHSFSEFNVDTGETALFNNPVTIDNIITRVTGGQLSSIDGLIQANGTANLFLLNPNGIQFGANARINIGGSFVGSTAESYLFADGSIYSATNPTAPPILTVNVPIGLQYGSNSTPIQVQEANLQLATGQTLTLAGGDLEIVGGQLRVPNGQISLGSLTAGNLTLDENLGIAGLSGTTTRGNINLSQQSLVEVTGVSEGIDITTGNLTLTEGSRFQSLIEVPGEGGNITIDATDLITIDGLSDNGGASSIFSRSVGENGGIGGNITINQSDNPQGNLIVSDQGSISTDTESNNNGGDIQVNVNSVNLTSSDLISSSTGVGDSGNLTITSDERVVFEDSVISTRVTGGNGNAGTITIDTENIRLTDSEISASNLAQGNAGNILIDARERLVLDSSFLGSELQAETEGNAGNITITTNNLELQNGSFLITTKNLGKGNGGNIAVEAIQVALQNGSFFLASTEGEGNSGNITINSRERVLLDSGSFLNNQITSSALGDAGNITITTNNLDLQGRSFINSKTEGRGNAGNLQFNTVNFSAAQGSFIDAINQGEGQGGNVTINATDKVSFTGSSFIINQVGSDGVGNAGNIEITGKEITLEEGSFFVNNTIGNGNAGNIEINADNFSLQGESFLVANAEETGNAGDIRINAPDTAILDSQVNGGNIITNSENVLISNGQVISINNQDSREGGNIEFIADNLTLDNNASIAAETVSNQGGIINLTLNDRLLLRRNSNINASSGTPTSGGDGGNITIVAPVIIAPSLENSNITANAFGGNGGIIDITTNGIFGLELRDEATPLSDFRASQFRLSGNNPTVTIDRPDEKTNSAKLPNRVTVERDRVIVDAAGCASAERNSLTIAGEGGLPEDPTATIRGQTVLSDLRDFTESGNNEDLPPVKKQSRQQPPKSIVQVKGWIVNQDGEVELVAALPQETSFLQRHNCN